MILDRSILIVCLKFLDLRRYYESFNRNRGAPAIY